MSKLLKNELKIIVVLFLFGLLIILNKYLYLLLLGLIILIVVNQKRSNSSKLLLFFTLIPSIEISGRLFGLSPFIPWEIGKYLFILFSILGIFIVKNLKLNRTSFTGIFLWIILCLSITNSFFQGSSIKEIIFNGFGLLSSILGLIFFSSQRVSTEELKELLKVFILSNIHILAFIIVNSGNITQIEYNLGANFETTGGFGSNQISTLLGFNFGLLVFTIVYKFPLFKSIRLQYLLATTYCFWTLISFSRGGFVTPILSLVLVLLLIRDKYSTLKTQITALFFSFIIFIVFISINSITNNVLFNRYMGETGGTLSGSKEKTLSVITTNRSDIFISDIDIWLNNPWLGVGFGNGMKLRENKILRNEASHIEVSRILAEQGLLGLILILGILFCFASKFQSKKNLSKKLSLFFFFLSIISTFHSAFRTSLSPLFFSLSFIIINESGNLYRKRIK